jgi:hypothetical protein
LPSHRPDVAKEGTRLVRVGIQHFIEKASYEWRYTHCIYNKSYNKYLMSNQEEIKNIIAQLKQLQLTQAGLLQRLDQLSGGNDTTTRPRTASRSGQPRPTIRSQNTSQQKPRGVIVSAHGFVVGDRVAIQNPGPSQAARGVILKIGTSRITVEAEDKTRIIRNPKNLKIED